MAQLQEGGTQKNDIEAAMEQDMLIEEMTYLQNHQSQPLSVLGPENQLQTQTKPKNGQSQQLGAKAQQKKAAGSSDQNKTR